MFAALAWERRAVTSVLRDVETVVRGRRWRGRTRDGRRCVVVQTGIGTARARAAAEEAGPAGAFLACGCAGSLVDRLAPGDVVVAERILALDADGVAGKAWPAESNALATALAAGGVRAEVGAVASSVVVLPTAAAKRAAAACGALVVEMESAAIAAVAAARGVPFVGLRVVLDAVDDGVPELGALDPGTGAVRVVAAAGLALRPQLWPVLARLARQQRIADTSLRRALPCI